MCSLATVSSNYAPAGLNGCTPAGVSKNVTPTSGSGNNSDFNITLCFCCMDVKI